MRYAGGYESPENFEGRAVLILILPAAIALYAVVGEELTFGRFLVFVRRQALR